MRGAEQNKAKQLCSGCPVRTECLAEALDHQIEWGVWGGMTERERRALLRRHPNASWRAVLEKARGQGRAVAGPAGDLTHGPSGSYSPGKERAHAAQPLEIVDVAGERRHHRGGDLRVRRREPVAEQHLPLDQPAPVGVQPQQPCRE